MLLPIDEGDFNPEQLDQWNAVWQKHGATIEELEIASRASGLPFGAFLHAPGFTPRVLTIYSI